MLEVKIKKLIDSAVIPSYAKPGDAGMDLTATSVNETLTYIEYGTGLTVEIPENYVGLIFPRSSISKYGLILANSIGVIDSGYRGEILCRFKVTDWDNVYNVGERVAQIIILPYPQVKFILSDQLSETERGDGGFGHTNK